MSTARKQLRHSASTQHSKYIAVISTTVSVGATINTAPPWKPHTFPAKVQLSIVAAASSTASAPAALALLLAKVQPLTVAAPAANTAPPAAETAKVGSLRKLFESSDTWKQRLCKHLWTVCQLELWPIASRTNKNCTLQVERLCSNAYIVTAVLFSAKLRAD
eukprot:12970-Heterococcus_DN1.PRE.2